MGSKKLKRKKIKDKKLVKLIKLYRVIGTKHKCFKGQKKAREKPCLQNDINGSQLFNSNKYSRFPLAEAHISDIRHFAELREKYFSYLQQIVCENCAICNSRPKEDALENITLKLEQHALLASLQADIYEKSILEVISDIEKSTQERQVNEKVKQLLPEVAAEDALRIRTEKSPSVEVTAEIPAISNSPTPEIIVDFESNCIDGFNNNNSVAATDEYYHSHNQDQSNSFSDVENCAKVEDCTNYSLVEISETSQSNCNSSRNLSESVDSEPSDSVHVNRGDIVMQAATVDCSPENAQQIQQLESEDIIPINTEEIMKNINEERERALIAHILEGSDSDNNDGFHSSSDNENDSKENVNDTNLLSRLERMKEIFGVDEQETGGAGKAKPKTCFGVLNQANSRNRRPSIWRHEKVIQMYKYSMISSELILDSQIRKRKHFLELFGSDSDDEHEAENRCEEKFRAACKERISSWVVKYLMPFYCAKKIIGRNTFKSLGHHISDCIVDKILYPDEWSVKYFVSKFFPPKKKYFCVEDVAASEYW